jgi:hypothetical protein
MSSVHRANFKQAYQRYSGPLASELPANLGMNTSTHVAQVCLNPEKPDTPERAVVKHFQYFDRGWANEYLAWTLAQVLGVPTAPRAALLIGKREDVTADHGPELLTATRLADGPLVLWCTSAVTPTRPLQQVLGRSWETAALRVDSGRLMGALDGWVANCDRIENNALYWVAQGALVAIDHEKLAFGQDWINSPLTHEDEETDATGKPVLLTRLIDVLLAAKKSKDKAIRTNARTAAYAMFEHSKTKHPVALSQCLNEVATLIQNNFSTKAYENLISFLDYRVSEECLKKRYGFIV